MDTSLSETELYERYSYLIKSTIRRYFRKINTSDYPDMCQAGAIGLLKAIRTFDPSKKCKIETWIIGGIRRYILNFCNRFYRYKNKTKVSYVDMENFLNHETNYPSSIDFNWDGITETNKRIIQHVFWDNMDYVEIGKLLKISKQAVFQRYTNTFKKLRKNNANYEVYLDK